MNELSKCPICSYDAGLKSNMDINDNYNVQCKICGPYSISRKALLTMDERLKFERLSPWIREKMSNNEEPPSFNSKNLKTILENIPNYSVTEKQIILLKEIERRTRYPGDLVELQKGLDYPLAWANNGNELHYYVQELSKRGLIENENEGKHEYTLPFLIKILADGWELLEDYETYPTLNDQVFVAMSFSEVMNNTWELGIKEAIKEAGYRAYRVDKEPHNKRIDSKIIAEIKNSKFIVADVTEQKQGVYYEAGYAQGLKREVIWCVRKDDLNNVHFDTRQFAHVVWENIEDLKEKLYDSICAVVGRRERKNE